ncbi:hypothetical protein tb265_00180 [Gemmatimonadetes bacterium T265]|nr:hypothetical protein tb265_00180 [Gemmatimonadetes bacterium T265]
MPRLPRSLAPAAALLPLLVAARAAHGQTFSTGQVVYAAPSTPSYWYSGCVVGAGRSNASYQVACAGTTFWVTGDHIRTSAPPPYPDPMRPGQTITPVITPSNVPAAAAQLGTPAAAPAPAGEGPGSYAQGVARRIARDNADAASAVLRPGTYPCYAGGQYTFSDLVITGPHRYTVQPGGSGAFSLARGVVTFASGPYAGAYARMVDGHTVGVSAKGNTDLGTQCGLKQ